jgi:hypothetical protein
MEHKILTNDLWTDVFDNDVAGNFDSMCVMSVRARYVHKSHFKKRMTKEKGETYNRHGGKNTVKAQLNCEPCNFKSPNKPWILAFLFVCVQLMLVNLSLVCSIIDLD